MKSIILVALAFAAVLAMAAAQFGYPAYGYGGVEQSGSSVGNGGLLMLIGLLFLLTLLFNNRTTTTTTGGVTIVNASASG